MKLITRFILIYLSATLLVLAIGGVIAYGIITDEINNELKNQFVDRIDRAAWLIDRGRNFDPRRDEVDGDRNMVIDRLRYDVQPTTIEKDTLVWNDDLERMEPNLKVIAYRNIDGRSWYISTYGTMIESEDIAESVLKTILWIFGLQIVSAFGIGFFVSGQLFKPFRQTLDRIQGFKLQQSQPVRAEKTGVKEFDDLNLFVEEMTGKAVSDYRNLKEFSENASHELQTPLAIAKGKLELLTETPLNPEQYEYVDSLQRTVKKLSRLGQSLALLTRIENHEYIQDKKVDFSHLISDGVDAFRDFIELNHLNVETVIEKGVLIKMDPMLADILWTNLFQNAIRHNVEGGQISVELEPGLLTISNTGQALDRKPEELFERFKKSDQSADSIGLGLSIVKRIVDQYNFKISYKYDKSWRGKQGWHIVQIEFPANSEA